MACSLDEKLLVISKYFSFYSSFVAPKFLPSFKSVSLKIFIEINHCILHWRYGSEFKYKSKITHHSVISYPMWCMGFLWYSRIRFCLTIFYVSCIKIKLSTCISCNINNIQALSIVWHPSDNLTFKRAKRALRTDQIYVGAIKRKKKISF